MYDHNHERFKLLEMGSISRITMDRLISTIKRILKNNDVVRAGLFGSYARGEAKKHSDIDLIVEFKGKKSLFDFVGLKFELEDILKKKVDLLTYKSLHPLLKERILREEKKIL